MELIAIVAILGAVLIVVSLPVVVVYKLLKWCKERKKQQTQKAEREKACKAEREAQKAQEMKREAEREVEQKELDMLHKVLMDTLVTYMQKRVEESKRREAQEGQEQGASSSNSENDELEKYVSSSNPAITIRMGPDESEQDSTSRAKLKEENLLVGDNHLLNASISANNRGENLRANLPPGANERNGRGHLPRLDGSFDNRI